MYGCFRVSVGIQLKAISQVENFILNFSSFFFFTSKRLISDLVTLSLTFFLARSPLRQQYPSPPLLLTLRSHKQVVESNLTLVISAKLPSGDHAFTGLVKL